MAQKEQQKMQKQASTKKKTKEVIVSPKDVPNAKNGRVVSYKGQKYRVVQANYRDSKGPGVVLAAYEGLENDPMGMSLGADPSSLQSGGSQGQEYARTRLDIEQTYDFDQDVAWGTESAQATADQIAAENATDRTTVDGYYSRPQGGMGVQAPVADDLDGLGDDEFQEESTDDLDGLGDDEFQEELTDDLDGLGDDFDDENIKSADDEFGMETLDAEPANDIDQEEEEVEIDEEDLMRTSKINNKIISFTNRLAKAFEEELEDSLEYAESVIKRTVPGRYARPVLASLEKSLDQEGIEVEFDKQISNQQIKKTASERATNKELVEVRNFVNTAISEDTEEILEEAEGLIEEEVYRIAKATKTFGVQKMASIEDKMKSVMERKLKSMGIHARFDRKYRAKSNPKK
jgi:hypothetical protein